MKITKDYIEKELKLSKKLTKEERYEYLMKEIPTIDYIIELENYVNKMIFVHNFLMKRENKLVRIEEMFINKEVDLDKLSKIVLGDLK